MGKLTPDSAQSARPYPGIKKGVWVFFMTGYPNLVNCPDVDSFMLS